MSRQSETLEPPISTFSGVRPGHSPLPGALVEVRSEQGRYRLRFASGARDLDAVLRLRFEVFNRELGEGLDSAFATGRDEDPFDAVCHHLMVEDRVDGRVVGTYRMQTREMAEGGGGFYSAGEFELSGLSREVLMESVEIGRACVAREHRNRQVLFLLWKGLASYLTRSRRSILFGCSSLTSQDPAVGWRAYEQLLSGGHGHPEFRIEPRAECACEVPPEEAARAGRVEIPVLFRTYLRHGAKICGPPAIDRAFKTIDFLTLLDTRQLREDLRRLYFAGNPPVSAGRGGPLRP